MTQRITIKVPATTANMGPGFDCLGMALDIWNSIEVEVGGDKGFEITGQGERSLPKGESNLVYRSFKSVFDGMGQPVPDVRISCRNEITLGRGLGSSAAAVAGGLMAANEVSGGSLSTERLLELAVEIEGHPDNAAAAIMGGCQIIVQDENQFITAPIPIPEGLKAVLFIPETPMPTEQARGLLPATIDRSQAVYNIGRVALLVRAFATGDLQHLNIATQDQLHQPARQEIFFPMKNIFRAAIAAGAMGVFLSGAGSSILALTKDREFTIGYEMADAASKSAVGGEIKVTTPTQKGAHVIRD